MGVKGLWQLISHTGRPIKLESLSNKRLAVDASIWLYQFIKAMRDPSGKLIHGAHLIGFFKRICKLLYYGIKPIFVFDGKPPDLKKQTMAARKTKRMKSEANLKQTASKILSAKLKLAAIDTVSGSGAVKRAGPEIDQSNKKQKVDEFHLPDLDNDININDPRFLSQSELLDFIQENAHKIDLSLASIESSSFKNLPPEVQHSIILDLKLQSRQPSKERLDSIVSNSKDALDFSKNQIQYLVKRNYLTEKSMEVAKTSRYIKYLMDRNDGLEARVSQKIEKRVAGERNRQFALIKEDNSGGYTMRVKSIQPIELDDDAAKSDEVQISTDSEGSDVFEFVSSINSGINSQPGESITKKDSQFEKTDDSEVLFSNAVDVSENNDFFKFNFNSINFDKSQIFADLPFQEKSKASKEELLNDWVLSAPSSLDDCLPNYVDLLERAIFADEVSEIAEIIESGNPKNLDHAAVTFLSEFMNTLSNNSTKNLDHVREHRTPYPKEKRKKLDIFSDEINGKEDKRGMFIQFEEKQPLSDVQGTDEGIFEEEKQPPTDVHVRNEEISDDAHKSPSTPDNNQLIVANESNLSKIVTSSTGGIISSDKHESDLQLIEDENTSNPRSSKSSVCIDNSESSDVDENLDVSGDVEEENDILDIFFSNLNPGERSLEIESELSGLMSEQRKEMRDASDINSLMMLETQELIKLFGLPYMESPSEAESQCAFLVEQGIADGIITDDSDVFLFGGTYVYRHFFNQQKYCELFKAEDLKQQMKLDRDRLIRLAYLVGSDYTVGLKGLGPVTSLEILREWDSYGIDGLIQFRDWAKEVQNLKTSNGESSLKIKLRKAVAKLSIPTSFPDQRVYDAYTNPTLNSNCEHFNFGVPIIDKLRRFMHEKVGWSEVKTDQILLPVINEMKRSSTPMVQTSIQNFFPKCEPSKKSHGSKRVQEIIKDWN